jgi:hypothetical protein
MRRKQPGKKICSRCNVEKYIDDEFQKRKGPNYFSTYSWCKVCHAEHQKLAREPKKKESNKRIQELRTIRRIEVQKIIVDHLKSHPCISCNQNNILCLDFDHRDPQEKEFCISSALSTVPRLKRLRKEIDKCDILCANCHRIKTAQSNNNFKVKMGA